MVTNESWKGKQKTKIRFWDLGDLGVLAFSRVLSRIFTQARNVVGED